MNNESIVNRILKELTPFIEVEKAKKYPAFFQVRTGGYGEGDKFLGIRVPNIRTVAKNYYNLNLDELEPIISSEYHEIRMLALFILIKQFQLKKFADKRDNIVEFYLAHLDYVNNWDLVDISAPKILGQHLLTHDRNILYELAQSEHLWRERISILATFTFIRNLQFEDALKLIEYFLNHKHDLIHKACGWMLREIGNRHRPTEVKFLDQYYKILPRTMLRYAIEKFSNEDRQNYLKGTR